MLRLIKGLILAAVLVPMTAMADTQYIYRHIRPAITATDTNSGQGQGQGSTQLSVAAQASVSAYSGNVLTVAPPAVSNAARTPTWALLMGTSDISSGLGTYCPGMAFNTSTGSITGTPSGSCSMILSYRITVPGAQGQDATTSSSPTFPFTVVVPSISASPSSTSIKGGVSFTLTGYTNLQSPSWSVTGNPPWMTFSQSGSNFVGTGLSQTVSQTTSYQIKLQATSGATTLSTTAYATVEAAVVGLPFSTSVHGGQPFNVPLDDPAFDSGSWSVTSNPDDLSGFAISAGSLVGTAPLNRTDQPVYHTIKATGPNGATSSGRLYVYPRPYIGFNTGDTGPFLTSGTYNVPFQTRMFPIARNVIGTAVWSIGDSKLPAGLTFDPVYATFSGTPTEFGTWYINLMMTDTFDMYKTNVSLQLNIVNPQDIYFYQHTSSDTYFIDFGNPGTGANQTLQDVIIRNVSGKDVTLNPITITGDSSDVDAFQLSTGTVNGAPGTYSQSHSGYPAGQGSTGASSPVGVQPCSTRLNAGLYCSLPVRFAGSSPGAKTGTLTVTTQGGGPSTIPLRGVTSGFVPAGSILVTQPGYQMVSTGANRSLTVRYIIIGGGNAGQTNGSYGGNSGVVAYGDTITGTDGLLGVTVGQAATTYQGSNGGNYQTSNIGRAYAAGATSQVGFAATGGFASGSYDGGNGQTGQSYSSGAVYGTIAGVVDARYGYPNKPFTAGFKLASILLGAGGKGHAGIATGCGAGNGIRGGAGGGGGIKIMVGAPGGTQTLVVPDTPAAAGATYVNNLPGGGGEGFGGGGGGSETQSGTCAKSSPFFGAGGAGAQGVAYVEWDAQ